ncbi:MAG: glycosyltransferase family 2 protein [Lautropia sp.]|nr:MAG: glycosyltransferase family 2 protein [Planctomycetota bacterium]MBC6960652.1 glycosyltransferase family 2 protein [Lautropia sp.]MBW7928755.1 glycosyltransferase family 2 protein [Fimbriimonadaceae bacterium]MDL1907955.1 glycosyltransferase family 2 protein [Betaproteobacteria bacterium PRO1]RIK87452.1 MAG: glycosyltransferase family 2 protein [Burkholderiales bacterium]
MSIGTTVGRLPITVLLAVKNEAANLPRCLGALRPAERVVVLDSHSTDETPEIARRFGAEVVQFTYGGGYPKKRQWALENLSLSTPWVLLLDADEVVPDALWVEIAQAIAGDPREAAFMVTKGFHFLGRPMQYGGFSHAAVLLFRAGRARFERLFDDVSDGLDMEIHERVVVDGPIGRITTPLIHEDFKGLEAYIARHNRYSTWEARLRHRYLSTGRYGEETIKPRFLGNSQERRRAIKSLIVRMPFEHWLWFAYHYFFRLGLLEGRPGLIACQIRASYIAQVRAKMYELGRSRERRD